MKYVVYQDDISCGDYVKQGQVHSSWGNGEFDDKREAEIYAFMWAYPYDRETSELNAPTMELYQKYDYTMGGVPVLMEIRIKQ